MEPTTIRFFDLGAYDGADTIRFFANMKPVSQILDVRLMAYMIEANPDRMKSLPVEIDGVWTDNVTNSRMKTSRWNFAVSGNPGRHPLYLAPCDEGNSIYVSKSGCSEKKQVMVDHRDFCEWVDSLGLRGECNDEIWILKANIEGAEWDLIQSLEERHAWNWFDIFCGTAFYAEDMDKVRALVDHRQDALALIAKRAPVVVPFSVPTANYPMPDTCADLGVLVADIIARREP